MCRNQYCVGRGAGEHTSQAEVEHSEDLKDGENVARKMNAVVGAQRPEGIGSRPS